MNTVEKKQRGGYRPNAGRRIGSLGKKTLDQKLMKEALNQRYLAVTEKIANAQIHVATGQTFLYKIEKEFIKTGSSKNGEDKGYWRSKRPVLVEAQWEIEDYLSGLVEEGDMDDDQDPGATYYYITTKEPNNMAIDSIFNRVHGKPKESVALDVEHKFSLKTIAQRRDALHAVQNPPKIIDIEVDE